MLWCVRYGTVSAITITIITCTLHTAVNRSDTTTCVSCPRPSTLCQSILLPAHPAAYIPLHVPLTHTPHTYPSHIPG